MKRTFSDSVGCKTCQVKKNLFGYKKAVMESSAQDAALALCELIPLLPLSDIREQFLKDDDTLARLALGISRSRDEKCQFLFNEIVLPELLRPQRAAALYQAAQVLCDLKVDVASELLSALPVEVQLGIADAVLEAPQCLLLQSVILSLILQELSDITEDETAQRAGRWLCVLHDMGITPNVSELSDEELLDLARVIGKSPKGPQLVYPKPLFGVRRPRDEFEGFWEFRQPYNAECFVFVQNVLLPELKQRSEAVRQQAKTLLESRGIKTVGRVRGPRS